MHSRMAESLVGAGGWGYFSGGLAAYAQAFRFVELNASFYRQIPDATARRWRALVPADFVFSVKAHRDVSHGNRLRASAQARAAFAQSLRTAGLLRASFVILETPASLPFDAAELEGLRDLAAMVPHGTQLGLEARAYSGRDLPAPLRRAMEGGGVLDVVDLSQSRPRVRDETQYTRLFGPGPHNVYEFDDEELREIDRR